MGVNKNFVVKNGLEVNDNLILADASTKNVGIGSTIPTYTLDVAGGIGVTHIYATGISTFASDVEILQNFEVGTGGTVFTAGVGGSVGVGTNLPAYLLEVRSPVSTGQTALYVYGDVRITGDINADDLFFDDIVAQDLYVSGIGTVANLEATEADLTNLRTTNISGTIGTITNLTGTSGTITSFDSTNLTGTIGTITTLESTSGTITNLDSTNLTGTIGTITTLEVTSGGITNLNVTGLSTFVGFSTFNADVYVAGIVTAATYYGDGSNLDGLPVSGVGLQTAGGYLGAGATTLDFRGPGISTVTLSSGIGTIYITGGGGGASVSISTNAPATPSSGDLWFSPDYARTFIWYDENTVGYGTSAAWVDASPSNGGSGGGGASVSISTAAPTSPNNGDLWFSVDLARTFIYYDEPTIGIGSTAVWVDAAPHQPANSSLTIATRDTGAVVLSIVGAGLTISLRSGIGTASF